MLDTAILTISRGNYVIIDHDKFTPSTKGMLDNPKSYFKYVNNPTEQDKKRGIYKPRLTIYKRGMSFDLKIEFSAPKLKFNNNLNELKESDFEEIIKILLEKLKDMGVIIYTHALEQADVLSFHPSKNILLTQGYTANFAIRELSKIDISEKFDLEKIKFRNSGQALQFYTNSHSFIFYDKINDIGKPSKRAIDKDRQQLSLFGDVQKEKRNLEVLRFEVRLSKKRKMNEILKEVGYKTNPQFKDIFKKDLCQKILILYWEKFFKESYFLFDIHNSPQKILQLVLQKYQKEKISKIIQMVGLCMLCKDDEGIRGFRQIIGNYRAKTNWTAVKRKLDLFKNDLLKNPHGFIGDIENNLCEFDNFRLF